MVSRRAFLNGAVASVGSTLAGSAWGGAPEQSLRPLVRPNGLFRRSIPDAADLIARAELGGRVGFAVADATTGQMLEVVHPLYGLPPASVAKAVTTAYGLDRLGPGYRFRTQLVTDGVLADGRLDGDLWLVGSGDPILDTDALAGMAGALADAGLREVTGQLRLATDALPSIFQIDPGQLPHAGYNPSISALNLNFNRVHFEWLRENSDYTVTMQARSSSYSPGVQSSRMSIEDRGYPVYTYENTDEADIWTVARSALGNGGARWLPTRRPAVYVAEVFQTLARSYGIVLDGPAFSESAPMGAAVLVEHVSEPLEDILRGMMRWSTNLTAEVVGLLATQAGGIRPATLAESGAEMSAWMEERLGARNPRFVDHSGLGVDSRVRPQDMTRALVTAGPNGLLRDLMKDIALHDAAGNPMPDHPLSVVAKTGTLNFVSTLAGYVRLPTGRDLAFSIFCADLERRAALTEAQMERPPGGRSYNTRAKHLQQVLIERWGAVYA